jgi:Ni,Fe-hydrogenase III large subunit
MGESVLRLEERLGWKHKGIERRFVGMMLAEGARLAGRVSGDSTVAYAWAYSQAAEAISGTLPPARALWLRALLLERERIANHLGDLGYLGNDVALAFGLMQFMRLKEDWARLNAQLFGHRLLMDRVIPGGVAVDLDAAGAQAIIAQCHALERELRVLKNIYDEHAGLQDRFLTTGRVTPQLAKRLGVIGLAGRASAQWWDLRCNHPGEPYDQLETKIATERNGDVAARALVRLAEIKESLRLIHKIVSEMPPGSIRNELRSEADRRGFGWIEGWRGDVLVALETGSGGKIRRCHCHDPSWQNWPALEHAAIDNIVPDFPLINKSFNLSYAGQDL